MRIFRPEVHYVEHRGPTIDIGPHVFPIEKYAIVPRLIRTELGVGDRQFHTAETIAATDLLYVHTPSYVSDLEAARATPATMASELPIEAAVIQGFIAMAGGSLTAVRLALTHGVGFHLGGGFHHAFPDHAEGFCYVHDVAVALERIRADHLVDRVLILDVDVHQGNGTAAIYAGRADTFTYSIHQEHNYPIKQRSDLDRGLPDGIENDDYLQALTDDLDAIDEQFDPELVCYVAGVDPYERDQLGGLRLTKEGLARRDRIVFDRFLERQLPVAVVLAGGYAPSPDETAHLHLETARAAEEACAVTRR